jgi:hypothetical protein
MAIFVLIVDSSDDEVVFDDWDCHLAVDRLPHKRLPLPILRHFVVVAVADE